MNPGQVIPANATPVSTTDANAVTLITVTAGNDHNCLTVINTGSGTGDALVSINNGTTYPYFIPAGTTRYIVLFGSPVANVLIKRNASTDVSNAYGSLSKSVPGDISNPLPIVNGGTGASTAAAAWAALVPTSISSIIQVRTGAYAALLQVVLGAGEIAVASDYRVVLIGDGVTAGGKVQGPWQLFNDVTAHGNAAQLNENTLKDIVIPANALNANGAYVDFFFKFVLSNTANKRGVGTYTGSSTPTPTNDFLYGLELFGGGAGFPNLTRTSTGGSNFAAVVRFLRMTSSVIQPFVTFTQANNLTDASAIISLAANGGQDIATITGVDFTSDYHFLLTGQSNTVGVAAGSANNIQLTVATGVVYPA